MNKDIIQVYIEVIKKVYIVSTFNVNVYRIGIKILEIIV